MNYEPVTAGNQTNRNAVADDAGKKITKEPVNKGERNGQEKEGEASNKEGGQHVQDLRAELDKLLVQQKEDYANSTNRVSTVSPSVSVAGKSFVNDLLTDPLMPDLEDTTDLLNTGIFSGTYDDEDVEPKKVTQALTDQSWIEAMQEELLQFRLKKVWRLVGLPKGKHAIRTKWVYKNKKDDRGIVVRNKARLVVNVKSAFLYGTIEEEVFRRGTIDKTLFIKKDRGGILLVQVYIDDIIFRSTKKSLCDEFEQIMHKRFQMSSMGELTFFLGLQVQQKRDGIFISQDKYVVDILKKFDFVTVKTTSTPIETNKALIKDEEAEDVDVHLYRSMIRSLMHLTAFRPDIIFAVCACARDSPFDLEAFSNSDYAGASLERKSTTGGVMNPKSNA
ncbi:putative ribonuclease H-like domain-containing protein [Tanacetum coccineum]